MMGSINCFVLGPSGEYSHRPADPSRIQGPGSEAVRRARDRLHASAQPFP